MNKRINLIKYCCLALGFISLLACSNDALQDFVLQKGNTTTVSSGSIAGSVGKTNDQLIIPVSIKLSSPASKAFEVTFDIDQIAAQQYITKNNLQATHVAVTSGSLLLPNSTKINFGSDSALFDIKITRTEVEKYFNKSIVIGYKITNAGKGNSINPAHATGIVVLKVADLITPADIHYLSLTNGAGTILEAKNQVNYEGTSTGMTIPIGISLASFPGSTFYVDIETSTDTIASLIQQGKLPSNTIALQPNEYSIATRVQVPSNAREAALALDVPWSVINNHLDKKLAVLVRLSSSTLHVINPEKSYTVILIDPENVVEVDVTNDGAFSVNIENTSNPGENSSKLIDRNYNSKFLLFNFAGNLKCTLVFPTPQKIGAYTMTSGGDAQERDPNEWFLEGSNDGVNWTTVDSRTGQTFKNRTQTIRFDIDVPQAFKQYRLNITSNVGSSLFQLAEWRMVRFP